MIDGRALDFHLWGINNQNFIMRDEQTGSWWQQVSGEAIQGPLKGRRLTGVIHDELSFGIWKAELFAKAGAPNLRLVDAETGSEWDFGGRALSGPLAGGQLAKVKALKEYWFDWKIYQPGTAVYTRGSPPPD